ncbi:MAG: N-acetyltransferase, partial [Anaerolineae bacterium]
ATLRDLGALRRLEKACFEADAWPLLDLIAVLTFPAVIRLKAVNAEEEIIGFIAGDVRASQNLAWIATLGVLPAYRRRGVGRLLLQTCESMLPVPRVRLSVRVDNRAAIHLYRQSGYQQVGIWPRYYNGGVDALVMEKELSQ